MPLKHLPQLYLTLEIVLFFQITVDFEVLYTTPDESTASFAGSQAYDMLDDDQQMLIDIEQNIANLEKTINSSTQENSPSSTSRKMKLMKRGFSLATPEKSPIGERSDRKRSSTFRNVRNLMRLGKQRPPKDDGNEEESLIHATDSGRNSRYASESESAPISRAESQTSLSSNADSQCSVSNVENGRKAARYNIVFLAI